MALDERLEPHDTYLQLHADGRVSRLPGGDAFWSLPPAVIEGLGRDWLISEHVFAADWPTWEMHPNGDEFVYLLSGSADLLFETAAGIREVALRGSGAVLVPRGVWHTARVPAPCRLLHVTMGAGTLTRPVARI